MADYYGTAGVVRVTKPRDKAPVESAVSTLSKHPIRYLAEETWTTLNRVGIPEQSHPISSGLHQKRTCS